MFFFVVLGGVAAPSSWSRARGPGESFGSTASPPPSPRASSPPHRRHCRTPRRRRRPWWWFRSCAPASSALVSLERCARCFVAVASATATSRACTASPLHLCASPARSLCSPRCQCPCIKRKCRSVGSTSLWVDDGLFVGRQTLQGRRIRDERISWTFIP